MPARRPESGAPVRTRPVAVVVALVALIGLIAVALVATRAAEPGARGDSFVITAGGRYSGIWISTHPDVPAVIVDTAEPVVIERSTISGPGDLVVGRASVHLHMRATRATGVRPRMPGRSPGRFVTTAGGFTNLVIESNSIEGTSGIWAFGYDGNRTIDQTLIVRYNVARDIDGRRTRAASASAGADAVEPAQFVQLDDVRDVPHIEIAWNDVVNRPGHSAVEDNINFYRSGGTERSPARVHHNYIEGAYPPDAATQPFSGGGILVGDTARRSPAGSYVEIADNVVVSTANYGISIVCGRGHRVERNRIVSSGLLADGRRIASQNVGLSVASAASWGAPCDAFADNRATANVIGWQTGANERNDTWVPDCRPAEACAGNIFLDGTITRAVEQAERERWEALARTAGVQLGA